MHKNKKLKVDFTLATVLKEKASVLFLLAVIVMPLVTGFLLLKDSKQEVISELDLLCAVMKDIIPADEHAQLFLTPNNQQLYKTLVTPLVFIHKHNPKIKYLYTVRFVGTKSIAGIDSYSDPAIRIMILGQYAGNEDYLKVGEPNDEFDQNFNKNEILVLQEQLRKTGHYTIPRIYPFAQSSLLTCYSLISEGEGYIDVIGIDYDVGEFKKLKRIVSINVLLGVFIGLLIISWAVRQMKIWLLQKQNLVTELDTLANTDSLTMLPNRHAFYSAVNLALSQQHTSQYIEMAIIDIDLFKKINDNYGHDIGDEALKLFANLLNQQSIKDSIFVGRVGGEEFAVFSVSTFENDIEKSLLALQLALANKSIKLADGNNITFTFSAGYFSIEYSEIASLPSFSVLMTKADNALYQSKNSGRNKITRYES